MREQLSQWDFVIAAYVVGIVGMLLLVIWSLAAMRRAERRRERTRQRP